MCFAQDVSCSASFQLHLNAILSVVDVSVRFCCINKMHRSLFVLVFDGLIVEILFLKVLLKNRKCGILI